LASMSERPRPKTRSSGGIRIRAAGSFALVAFVLMVALGFVR